MPLLSVSNATVTVTELFKGSAKFGRPSEKEGAGWIVTADKGDVSIQKQININGAIVFVVRWTNYMGLDGMNGQILLGLPILRQHDSVYFKTSSTTTRGARHKAPFCFKFEGAEEAEEFEMWWLSKNGSIASWKEEDEIKKKAGSNSNLPLQEKTNTVSTPIRKRKAAPMIDGPLRKKVKDADRLLNFVSAVGGGDSNGGSEKVEPLSNCCSIDNDEDDDIQDPCVVGALKTVKLMPTEVNVNGELREIVKLKRSTLKSILEQPNDEDNDNINDDKKSVASNEDNSEDSCADYGSSNDDEDVLIDEEEAPQSQNWTTAFTSYE
jgi:hypothetical protein